MSKIALKRYNYDTRENEIIGETDPHTLVRSMSLEQVCEFLSDYVNAGGKDYPVGHAMGVKLQGEHRTLQASVVRLCAGIIVGLSEQKYTDARNEMAVAFGRQLKEKIDSDEMRMGWMI